MRPVSSILALALTFAASSALAAPGAGFRGIALGGFGARTPAPALAPFGRNTPTVQERLRPGVSIPIGTTVRGGRLVGGLRGYAGGPGIGPGLSGGPGFGRGCGPSQGFGGCRGGDQGYAGGYGYAGLGFGYDLGHSPTGLYQVAPTALPMGVSGIRPAPTLPPTIYVVGADGSAGEPRREASTRTEARAGGPLIIRVP